MQFIFLLVVLILALGVVAGWAVWPKLRRTIHQKLAMVINEVMQQREHDVSLALARRATNDSAAWLGTFWYGTAYPDKWSLLEASLKTASALGGGLYCEFGVYQGASINFIAERADSVVHGFDSFEGLPEDWWPGRKKGRFKVDALPRVRAMSSYTKDGLMPPPSV